ncbi:hypothetical protein ACFY1P_20510 [Streptomyces sp. NPDC001407]|uniref:hypothetical protein n=1 Tax=Streptomyces sp. NPDC001407 TaxID=3364573 RepID=UPI00369D6268
MNATPWATQRLAIARLSAVCLLTEHPTAQVWLVSALAEHHAHARSDIDLLLITPDLAPTMASRIVDSVRVDVRAVAQCETDQWHTHLRQFSVTRSALEEFRTVRARLADLTLLRTARTVRDGVFVPVLDSAGRDGYRRWALADRAEVASSLAEDLVGLVEAGLRPHADLVWARLAITLAQAETVAAGAPLLSEKWLPSLHPAGGAATAPPAVDWTNPERASRCFAHAQVRLADALLTCWPVTAPAEPVDPQLTGFGWLPQHYADGWFLRNGDQHTCVPDAQVPAWRTAVAQHTRP